MISKILKGLFGVCLLALMFLNFLALVNIWEVLSTLTKIFLVAYNFSGG